MSLKEFLTKIQDEVKVKEEIRQEVQKDMRSATRLSKIAILMVHQGNFEEAENRLREAGELFIKLCEISKDHSEFMYKGIVDSAFQEYAEAYTFLKLVKENRFISFEDIGVPATSYVLGLADVIGELRRRVLDLLRGGRIVEAEDCLELMDMIYIELTGMDDAYFMISGLRRKCDIARRIIETTRGDVTIEMRRRSLEDSIRELKKTLEEEVKVGEDKTE
ncbi:MAG: haloacid dehalogenase [Candidatus Bathyarchaeia archaeon]